MNLFLVRKVLIVLEVTVIKPGSEVPGRIGNPKNVNENSSSDRQPQQNGTGVQQSMLFFVKLSYLRCKYLI